MLWDFLRAPERQIQPSQCWTFFEMRGASELFPSRIVTRPTLNVSVKSDRASVFPILRVVGINSRAVTQRAEEGALHWVDHNSHMPAPNHQVSWLRMFHAPELIGSLIQVGRTRIGITEPGLVINRVHQMRAINPAAGVGPRIEGRRNHR